MGWHANYSKDSGFPYVRGMVAVPRYMIERKEK